MVHCYPRRLFFGSIVLQDVLLAAVLIVLGAVRPSGSFGVALAASAAVVLGWGALTLHFPSRVVLSDAGISFHRYGRAHHFAWDEVRAVRVRRFVVRDRVLVRITPSSPWRGRYWILDGIERFDELVRGLEARAAARVTPDRRTRRAGLPSPTATSSRPRETRP